MPLSEDELWEARKEEARDLKGIGYRDNPFFDTIIAVTKRGGLYVWKTCAEREEGERVAREYAERVGVPYLAYISHLSNRIESKVYLAMGPSRLILRVQGKSLGREGATPAGFGGEVGFPLGPGRTSPLPTVRAPMQ